jgi:hypothetical protein
MKVNVRSPNKASRDLSLCCGGLDERTAVELAAYGLRHVEIQMRHERGQDVDDGWRLWR